MHFTVSSTSPYVKIAVSMGGLCSIVLVGSLTSLSEEEQEPAIHEDGKLA